MEIQSPLIYAPADFRAYLLGACEPPPPAPSMLLADPGLSSMLTGSVSEAHWAEWNEQGFVRLGVQLAPCEVRLLQERCDAIMMGTAAGCDYSQMRMVLQENSVGSSIGSDIGFKGATLEYSKFQGLEHDIVFLSVIQSPLFREVAAKVYGHLAEVAIYRATCFNKPRSGVQDQPIGWHQDQWLYLDREPQITLYLAIDDASAESGALHVLPASHRQGIHNRSPDGNAVSCGHLTATQIPAVLGANENPVALDLQAGELCLLSNYIVHRSGANTVADTGVRRRCELTV